MITSEWPTDAHPNWVPFIVQQVNFLRRAGIEIEVFSFRGSKKIINYIKAWFYVRKALKTKNYNLIHAQFGQSGLMALPKALPLVVTFHGSDLQGDVISDGSYTIQGKLLQVISKLVAFFANEVIVVSPALGKMINFRRNYHVIPCGLDLNLFVPIEQSIAREKLNFSMNKKLILFGGRPEMSIKRYGLARQVIALLGDMNAELIVTAHVPHDQMPIYLNACDVLLLTSVHEGSPTIVKEALACNLPIVSTDVGDVRERIGAIEGCIVCQNDNPETISVAVKNILSRNKRINGRETVLSLDENFLTQKVIQVYKEAINKN